MKVPVKYLSLSAAGLIALVVAEGFRPDAHVPTKNDKVSIGFGSTVYEDGRPVKRGDVVTVPRALAMSLAHSNKDQLALKESLPGVSLTQGEFDLYTDWVYNFGIGNWHKPKSPRTYLLLGEHVKACDALLNWRFQAGRDCSLSANWGPQGCKGVWTRQQERHSKCMAEQGDAK